jgi:hypothetical protein
VAVADELIAELAPEGPQRGDLASDVSAALDASPAAAAFFDTLAQFYRKAYLRWIDATARRPDLRAARIGEVIDLLAAGIKQRPRSPRQSTTRTGRPEKGSGRARRIQGALQQPPVPRIRARRTPTYGPQAC